MADINNINVNGITYNIVDDEAMRLASNPTNNNILITNSNGQAVDSGVDVNDTMLLTSNPTNNHILVTDSNGQAVDSGVSISGIAGGGTVIYDGDDTTDTSYDVLFFGDIGSGVESVKIGIDMELLWTNASPTSTFAAQTITVPNLSNYRLAVIYVRGAVSRFTYLPFLFFIHKTDAQLIYGVYDQAITAITSRTVTFDSSNNQITFSASSDANTMIPYQIYGIR